MSDIYKHTFSVDSQRKYMRIPFKEHGRDFDGCDCGGLVWLVYKTELGITLPDWREYYKSTQFEAFNDLSHATSTMLGNLCLELPKNEKPRPFDVVSLRMAGLPVHVGIMITENIFMHILYGYTNVSQERLDSVNWFRRLDGIFRYEGL